MFGVPEQNQIAARWDTCSFVLLLANSAFIMIDLGDIFDDDDARDGSSATSSLMDRVRAGMQGSETDATRKASEKARGAGP